MKTIEVKDGCKIFSWCDDIEEKAMKQMEIVAKLPFVKHVSLMPDCHLGMNTCIGSVVACDNVVVPDFCGVDAGCGMGAMRSSLHKSEIESEDVRKKLLHSFSRSIPVGFNHNTQKRQNELLNKYEDKIEYIIEKTKVLQKYSDHNPIGDIRKEFTSQLGTLGGGNHFIEIQYDEDGCIWAMCHSGSRNMGKRLGDYFNALAKDLNKKWYSEGRHISYLPVDTPEGKAYIAWLEFALRFAFLNRHVMLKEVQSCMEHDFPKVKWTTKEIPGADGNLINIHHNDTNLENQMGKNYWVHRKGATRAFKGQVGIIPGSMGTSSYITIGLGDRLSLMSSSHGAGRKMGRREYCRKMKNSYAQVEKSLEGVVHSEFGEFDRGKDKGMKDISEAPGAYKDIDHVMSQQEDLVKPIVKLKPLVVLKG